MKRSTITMMCACVAALAMVIASAAQHDSSQRTQSEAPRARAESAPPRPLVPGRSKVATTLGIVAASQPLAAQAGVQMLERGGTAVDAAIAANAVLGLVEPEMNGIGGDLFAIVFTKVYAASVSREGSPSRPLPSRALMKMEDEEFLLSEDGPLVCNRWIQVAAGLPAASDLKEANPPAS
jgi:gamma-glutamyltranspeptidase